MYPTVPTFQVSQFKFSTTLGKFLSLNCSTYIFQKALASQRKKDHKVLDAQSLFHSSTTDYVPPSIQGYNAWPFNTGKNLDYSAILDTGANSTYVSDR